MLKRFNHMQTWVAGLAALLTMCLAIPDANALPCSFFVTRGADRAHAWLAPFMASECEERDRVTFEGRQFVFIEVVGSRAGLGEARRNLAKNALQRATALYHRWFEIPEALIISGFNPALEGEGIAFALGDRNGCLIWLDRTSLHAGQSIGSSNGNQLKRIVAHEYFHCVHFGDPTVDNLYRRWRDEGVSEYFSGLAVSEAPPNGGAIDRFIDIEINSLYDLEHETFPFFAFLGNTRGPEAVVDFLRHASRTHTPAGDRSSLLAIPRVEELFHYMARDYTEGKLKDESGRLLPLRPALLRPNTNIERRGNYPVTSMPGIKPFTVSIGEYNFKRGFTWPTRNSSGPSALKSSWIERDTDHWMDLPGEIRACDTDKRGYILTTSTANGDGAQPFGFSVEERPGLSAECQCPAGSWHMNTAGLRATRWRSIGEARLVSGSITLNFFGNEASATYNDVTYEGAVGPDSKMRTVRSGTLFWTYVRRPWAAAGLATPAPSGRDIDAFAVERILTKSNAQTRVVFLNKGREVGSNTMPDRTDQSGGGKNIVAAYCVAGNELHLMGARSAAILPGSEDLPPYTGVYRR